MPDWIKALIAEAAVIQSAPWSFVVIATAIMAGTFLFVTWIYGRQIETKDANLKWQSEQIAEYKSKLGGATPDEAKKRLDALEIQVKALSPRRLTNDQKDKIIKTLGSVKGVIEIVKDMAVADAGALSGDFAFCFQAAGWTVSLPVVMGIVNPPRTGISFSVSNPTALQPNEIMIKSALDAAGVEYDLRPGLKRRPEFPSGPSGTPSLPREAYPDAEILITTKLS